MATVDTRYYTTSQPEAVIKGVNVAVFRISLSLSVSSGDVHRIGKIPHGAIPLDAVLIPGSALPANGAIAKFGTSASQELFFKSASLSTGGLIRTSIALGTAQQISLSDDRMPRYESIVMVNTATLLSVGYMADLIVYYKMPGQTLNVL
jgi:hypothetical protein